MFKGVTTPDSYSQAAAQRMFDMLAGHISAMREIGAKAQYLNLFFGERVRLDGRLRVLGDFVDLDLVSDGHTDYLKVTAATGDVVSAVDEICRDARLTLHPMDESGLCFLAPLPTPTDTEMQTMLDQVDRTLRSTMMAIARVKSDTMQRLTAAIKNEYVEPVEAKAARRILDQLHAFSLQTAEVLCLKKRQSLLGTSFRMRTDRDRELLLLAQSENFAMIRV